LHYSQATNEKRAPAGCSIKLLKLTIHFVGLFISLRCSVITNIGRGITQ